MLRFANKYSCKVNAGQVREQDLDQAAVSAVTADICHPSNKRVLGSGRPCVVLITEAHKMKPFRSPPLAPEIPAMRVQRGKRHRRGQLSAVPWDDLKCRHGESSLLSDLEESCRPTG